MIPYYDLEVRLLFTPLKPFQSKSAALVVVDSVAFFFIIDGLTDVANCCWFRFISNDKLGLPEPPPPYVFMNIVFGDCVNEPLVVANCWVKDCYFWMLTGVNVGVVCCCGKFCWSGVTFVWNRYCIELKSLALISGWGWDVCGWVNCCGGCWTVWGWTGLLCCPKKFIYCVGFWPMKFWVPKAWVFKLNEVPKPWLGSCWVAKCCAFTA